VPGSREEGGESTLAYPPEGREKGDESKQQQRRGEKGLVHPLNGVDTMPTTRGGKRRASTYKREEDTPIFRKKRKKGLVSF